MLQTSNRIYLIEHETKPLQVGNRQLELSYVNFDGTIRILRGERARLFARFAFQVSEYLVNPDSLSDLNFDQRIKLLASREVPALAVDYLIACTNLHEPGGLLLFGREEAALLWLVHEEIHAQTIVLHGRVADSDESFFYQKLHQLEPQRFLIEYEGGLILLSQQFEILWHLAKIVNHKVSDWQNSTLTISDGDSSRRIDILTGRFHDRA